MATIGKNILENLTTGMYAESRVAYREYIQNACDQIDKAIKSALITQEEASITIFIDNVKRYISIEDNATGVPADIFESELGDIANSNKKIGEDKGFRGIGRLCGLAYCKELVFTTSYKGENVKSIMFCDAEKMRKMLSASEKYTIDEVLKEIITFETKPEEPGKHYFTVELKDINKENTDLLDEKKVKEYLSFVAPVPYQNTFILRNQIYDYAKELNYKIDEYLITINGEQIFKEYSTRLKEQSGNNTKAYDEISTLEFKKFSDSNGEIIAWMWIGLSRFEKAIPKLNNMRGIRLKQSNIQLGENDIFKDLFKENRGYLYFVGEVFAVDSHLIPNSQRNYFNENDTRVIFEDGLRKYFHETLHKIYYEANKIKNSLKKQKAYEDKVQEFETKTSNGTFVDENAKEKMAHEVDVARAEAEKAEKNLEKAELLEKESPLAIVRNNIKNDFVVNKQATTIKPKATIHKEEKKGNSGYAVDVLSKLDKKERKLVSRIWSIIENNAPKDIAEELIEKIKEEFK